MNMEEVNKYRYFIRNTALNTITGKWDSLSQVVRSNACPCILDTSLLFDKTVDHLAFALKRSPSDYENNRVEEFNCLNPCGHNAKEPQQ